MQKNTRIPQDGDTRIKSGFLFFPKEIRVGPWNEIRWLEFATWEEKYYNYAYGTCWKATRWIDDE